uniref:Glutamine synthetase n=1 Tax=Neogobius melanostomus TaxID=47308 RepID=A0A8C6SH98_9GOBI
MSTNTMCLHRLARMPYLALPTVPHCQVTYIWISPCGKFPKGKTRTLDSEPQSVADVPRFNATLWIDDVLTEITLVPVRMFRDPFTRDPNKLVMCDALDLQGTPAQFHRRSECAKAMEEVKDQKPWFGFEQEFTLMALDQHPFGWRDDPYPTTRTGPRTPYSRTGVGEVGLEKIWGRDVSLSHYQACLYAGVKISGITNEGGPAQWEFQIGPCEGIELGDHAWTARYILFRVCEDFGVIPSFHPKLFDHPLWSSDGHMNFSTEAMRSPGGLTRIHAAIERLAQRHMEHVALYGDEHNNRKRMIGGSLSSAFDTFSWRTASRSVSVRIPGHVHSEGRGYLEDRRPPSDCDPYVVCQALVETCLPPPGGHNGEDIDYSPL